MIQANPILYAAALSDEALLEAVLKAPAAKLVQGYRFVKTLLDFVRLAEQGATIQTPTQTIGSDNAKQVRGELEQRRAI